MRWAGLVRNVMVGREGLDRATLIGLAERAGADDVRSHRTTGNLTFTAGVAELDGLVDQVEDGLVGILGRREMVAVRRIDELALLLAAAPYAGLDPQAWELEVGFPRHDAPPLDPARLGDPLRTVIVGVRTRELLTARPPTGGRRPHVNRLLGRRVSIHGSGMGHSRKTVGCWLIVC